MARRTGSLLSVAALALAVSAPLAVLAAFPGWARRAGLDAWNAPAERARLRDADARGRELDDEIAAMRRRHALAAQVIDRLGLGTLSLADAAAELEGLFRGLGYYLHGLRRDFPGVTDRERFARSAVERVRVREVADSGRHAAAVARVEAELAALYPPD